MKPLKNSFYVLPDFNKLNQFQLAIEWWSYQDRDKAWTYLDAVKECRAQCGDLGIAVAVCRPFFGIK